MNSTEYSIGIADIWTNLTPHDPVLQVLNVQNYIKKESLKSHFKNRENNICSCLNKIHFIKGGKENGIFLRPVEMGP